MVLMFYNSTALTVVPRCKVYIRDGTNPILRICIGPIPATNSGLDVGGKKRANSTQLREKIGVGFFLKKKHFGTGNVYK